MTRTRREIERGIKEVTKRGEERRGAIEEAKMKIVEKVLMQTYGRPPKPIRVRKVIEEIVETFEDPVEIVETTEVDGCEREQTQIVMKRVTPVVRVKPTQKLKSDVPPFILDPPNIDFKDMLPSRLSTLKIKIVNTSSSPKSFKLSKIATELSEYVKVVLEPSGPLCSGAEWSFKVHFTPSMELLKRAFTSWIRFQSSCGVYFEMVVRFSCAKCIPRFASVSGATLVTTDFIKPARDLTAKNRALKVAPLYAQLHTERRLSLRFPECVMGDVRKFAIRIVNEGSLDTGFVVETSVNSVFEPVDCVLSTHREPLDGQIFEGPFVIRKSSGSLSSYGTKTVHLSFEPGFDPSMVNQTAGNVSARATFVIKFDEDSSPFVIECHASTRALTVFPDRQLLNFKQCVPGRWYQDSFLHWNKNKNSRKFWIDSDGYKGVFRGDTKILTMPNVGVIEISPAVGFIQPNSSCPIWIKIKFDESCVMDDESFTTFLQTGYMEGESERFAPVEIKATLTPCEINVVGVNGVPELDFGSISVHEKKQLALNITNPSKFTQLIKFCDTEIFKFVSHSEDVSADIFRIAPESTVLRHICFEPKEGQNYKTILKFKTTFSQVCKVVCTGIGSHPPAHFDHSLVSFDPVPFGNHAAKRVMLIQKLAKSKRSSESREFSFAFGLPILLSVDSALTAHDELTRNTEQPNDITLSGSDLEILQVWPSSGLVGNDIPIGIELAVIAPSKSIPPPILPIVIQPKIERKASIIAAVLPSKTKSAKERNVTTPKALAKSDEVVIQAQSIEVLQSIIESPFMQLVLSTAEPIVSLLLPCTLTPLPNEEERLQNLLDGRENGVDSTVATTIYLKITIPICESSLHILEPADSLCKFGTTLVGKKVNSQITIQNLLKESLQLKYEGLSPVGPFFFPKAIRPILPGGKSTFDICFRPGSQDKFFSQLEFYAGSSKVAVRLSGEGLVPNLEIDCGKLITFNNACAGDNISKTVLINNPYLLPVQCWFKILSSESSRGSLNLSGHSPFSVGSPHTTILPNSSYQLSVLFSPDREHDNFYDTLSITYEGQSEPYLVKLTGRGWEVSTCVSNHQEHPLSFRAPSFASATDVEYKWIPLKSLPNRIMKELSVKRDELVVPVFSGPKKVANFGTISLGWKEYLGSELPNCPALDQTKKYWRVEGKEVVLANLKPHGKVEGGKKGTEFTIEQFKGSFFYDEISQDYVLTAKPQTSNSGFDIVLGPSKGSVDLGSSKILELVIADPVREMWNQSYLLWDRIDGTPIVPQQTRYQRSETSLLTHSVGVPVNQAQEFKDRVRNLEIKKPVYIEQVFKISFKGGYRFVEPKGPQQETRIFYLKVKAEP